MSTPQDAHAITARLRSLAELKPTPQRRAEVELMLDHKWEGVQSVAARAAARGDHREAAERALARLAALNDTR